MAVDLGSAKGTLDLDTSKFTSALAMANAQMKREFSKMEKESGATLTAVGTKMTSTGKALTTAITLPIVGAGAAIIKTTADFDESMSKVQALSGATGDDLIKLRDKAKEMGAKTKFSASESAEAFQYMALAGWKTGDMLDGIEGIMNLAAASGENLASVSDIVTDGLTAFGLQAKDSAHFADVLAAAMANSNTDVAGLGEAFKYVAPVAGAFGYSVEDVAIALGTMANAGIKGSSMGTSLRQALVQLTSPTDQAAAYMQQYGISLYDSEGKTKSLMTVMGDLRNVFGNTAQDLNLTQEQLEQLQTAVENDETAWYDYAKGLDIPATAQEKLTALTEIFGARAMPAMLAVIQSSEGDFNKLTDAIYGATKVYDNATGKTYTYAEAMEQFGDEINTNSERFKTLSTAAEMSQTMMDNLNGQITIIKSSLEGFAISLGELLMPYLRDFASNLQAVIDKFNAMSSEQKMQIIRIAGLVAAFPPLLMALGKVATGVGTAMKAFQLMRSGMTAAAISTSPLGAALAGLPTYFKHVFEAAKLSRAGFTAFASETSVVGAALGGITAPIAAVIAAIGVLVAAFVHLWNTNEEFRNKIIEIWNGIKSSFEGFCNGIVERLNSLGFEFESITDAIGAVWDAFCNVLAPVFETAFAQIAVILDTVFGILTGILDVFIGLFTGNWEQLWNGLTGIVSSVFNGVKSTVENILNNGVLGILRTFTGNANLTWQGVWNGIVSTAQSMGANVVNAVKTFISNVVTFFSQLPGKIAGFLSNVVSKVVSWASQMASNARKAGQQFLQNVSSFIQQLPYKVGNFLGTVIGTVAKWVVQFAQNARQAGQQFLQNVVSFVQQLPGRVAGFLSSVISNVVSFVSNFVRNALQAGQKFLQNVVTSLQQLPGRVASFLSNVISNVASWAATIPQQAQQAATNFLTNVSTTLAALPGQVAGFLAQVISTLATWVSDMGAKGLEAIQSLINNVISGAASIPGQMAAIGQSIVQGVWSGIQAAAGWFTSQVTSFFSGIVDGAKSALGINSPSKVFAKVVGKGIVEGIEKGIVDQQKSLLTKIDKLDAQVLRKQQLLAQNQQRLADSAGKKVTAATIQGYKDRIARYTKEVKDGQKQLAALRADYDKKTQGEIIKAAEKRLSELKKEKRVSVYQEESYWNEVAKLAEDGGAKTNRILRKARLARSAAMLEYVKNAQSKLKDMKKSTEVTAKQEEKYWKKVVDAVDKGSKAYKKANVELKAAHKAAQAEILKNAKSTAKSMKDIEGKSAVEIEAYWQKIVNSLDKGTQTRKEATEQLAKAHVAAQKEIYQNAKTSATEMLKNGEMVAGQLEAYWNKIAESLDANSEYQKKALHEAEQAHKQFLVEVDKVSDKYEESMQKRTEKFAEGVKKIQENYSNAVKKLGEDLENVNGLFGAFEVETGTSTDAMIENIQSQVTALTEYNNVMDAIRKRDLPSRLVDQLEEMGVKSLDELKNFNAMTDEQLQQYVALWEKRAELAQSEAVRQLNIDPYLEELETLIDETNEGLQEIHESYVESMKEIGHEVNLTMPQIGKDIVTTMAAGFQSSQGEFRNRVDSLASYVSSKLAQVQAAYREMARLAADSGSYSSAAVTARQTQLQNDSAAAASNYEKAIAQSIYDSSKTLGKQIPVGLSEGMAANVKEVEKASKEMAEKAVSETKSVLQIKSPSKRFANEIGAMLPPGLANGFVSAMPKSMQRVQDALDDGVSDIEVPELAETTNSGLESLTMASRGFYDDVIAWFEDAQTRMAKTTQAMLDDMASLIQYGTAAMNAVNGDWGEYGSLNVNTGGSIVRSSNNGALNSNAQMGGDTFIFNSPRPIDEIAAAKEMKRAKQDLAQGF